MGKSKKEVNLSQLARQERIAYGYFVCYLHMLFLIL